MITVGMLREVLSKCNVSDDTPIGISNYYGDMEEIQGLSYWDDPRDPAFRQRGGWLEIHVPYIGEEPD